ncbi:class I SAM-dependent methyltransferase [Waterburya agarophytonicola K14]|uniref:Class I SAM-dependent methyltransferase n=1 Tax=Waterburya agarophytonicola KI4 TaxID=2874699 RepID=A0A964BQP1_9CYAN|nr:class I SAM-dependent methyltransferase [Waterburya agarophytonicola]MCC0177645.1 class I SAM-dependent methyltransferase [Waterburya agarophytonicola KI4]
MIDSQDIKQYLQQFFSEEINSLITNQNEIIANQNDLVANHYLAPLSTSYLPWTKSAMRPSGLVAVLNEITINQRKCIVECGAGISTFYIARLLREKGGHLHTIEHDQQWCELLKQELSQENLSEYVSVIFAPLSSSDIKIDRENTDWYNLSTLKAQLSSLKIDLLIVDGPPAYEIEKQLSRYPALPFLSTYFAEDYGIILDDINRPGEQEILKAWEQQLGIVFERRLSQGNIAIARSKPSLII